MNGCPTVANSTDFNDKKEKQSARLPAPFQANVIFHKATYNNVRIAIVYIQVSHVIISKKILFFKL